MSKVKKIDEELAKAIPEDRAVQGTNDFGGPYKGYNSNYIAKLTWLGAPLDHVALVTSPESPCVKMGLPEEEDKKDNAIAEEKGKLKDVEKQQPENTKEADDILEKAKKSSSPVVNASLVLFYAAMSSMFIIGWVNLNNCPLSKMIPVYLIVAGSTGILTKALIHTRNKYVFNVVIVLVLFDLFWQGLGSYYVYPEYQPNYDPLKGVYCHRTAYLLSFWMITIVYAMLIQFILLSGCYFLMRNTFRKK